MATVLDSAPVLDPQLVRLLPQGMVQAYPPLSEETYIPLGRVQPNMTLPATVDAPSSLDRATKVMWSVALVCLGLSVVIWGLLLRDLP